MDIFNSSKIPVEDEDTAGEKPEAAQDGAGEAGAGAALPDAGEAKTDAALPGACGARADGIDDEKVEEIISFFAELRNNADTELAGGEEEKEGLSSEKVQMELYDWIQCFVAALIVGVLTFIFVGRTIGVDGSSMVDTLRDRDRVVMHNLLYTPKKGDIVVFQAKTEERFHDVPLVKRVIATAGDTLDIDFGTGAVYINGQEIFEPYIHTLTTISHGFEGPIRIPEGYIFVMGDNRNNSSDSRDSDVGLVDTRYILGRVIFLLIPGDNPGEPRDWSRFGAVR